MPVDCCIVRFRLKNEAHLTAVVGLVFPPLPAIPFRPTRLWAIVCTADFQMLTVVIVMSVLTAIWDPTAARAETARVKGRGIKRKAEAEWDNA